MKTPCQLQDMSKNLTCTYDKDGSGPDAYAECIITNVENNDTPLNQTEMRTCFNSFRNDACKKKKPTCSEKCVVCWLNVCEKAAPNSFQVYTACFRSLFTEILTPNGMKCNKDSQLEIVSAQVWFRYCLTQMDNSSEACIAEFFKLCFTTFVNPTECLKTLPKLCGVYESDSDEQLEECSLAVQAVLNSNISSTCSKASYHQTCVSMNACLILGIFGRVLQQCT